MSTDKTDIKVWLKKASKAIFAATEAEAAEDISEGLSMALLRIAELETERDKWHQDAVNQMHKYGQLSDELLVLTAERDKWKAAAETKETT